MMNKRKYLLIIVIILFISFAALIMKLISEKIEHQSVMAARKKTLPSLPLFIYDSIRFDLNNIKYKETVIIYFNTECSHCEYEAQEVRKNIEKLREVNLIWVSSESLMKIRDFAINNGLDQFINITFAKINQTEVQPYLGHVVIPSVFIYSKERVLLKEFKGETSIDNVLKIINNNL